MVPLRLIACCLVAIAATHAGEAMTVDEAVALALANNERAAIARERLVQADGARREAWAAFLPNLTASGGYSVSDPSGNANQGRIDLAMRILDPPSFPQLRMALALYEAQRLDADELRRILAFDVADAFAGVLAAESLAEAAEKRLAVNDEALKQARLNVEAGLVARNELTRTEVEQSTAAGALVRARIAARRNRLALGHVIGVALDRPLANPSVPADGTPDAATLVAEAQQRRQDIQALALRQKAAVLGAREPALSVLPRIDLRGSAGDGTYLGHADDPRYAASDTPFWSIGITATWTLYDGGARYGRAKRLASMAREADLNERAARRQVDLDVNIALEEITAARAALATAQVRLQAAQRNQSETHARFINGLATAIEEADATASTYEASAELAGARYALWQAWLAINRTVGRWPSGTHAPQDGKP